MPPAIDKDAKIPCPAPQHLQAELEALASVLELAEKEDTWEKMERAILRFAGVTRGGGYKHLPLYVEGIGKIGCGLKIAACMLSDRGRLSGVATELLQTLAPRLAHSFLPLIPVYLPPLIQLLGRPNKVFLKRAEKCLQTIITNCPLLPVLNEVRKGLNDEAATCRRGCATGFERAMMDWDKSIFGEKGVGYVEEAIRRAGTDKDVEVRAIGKRIWGKYCEIWPERVDEFSDPLTPTIRRYLGVGATAKPVAGPSKPKAARSAAPRVPFPVAEPLSAPLPPSASSHAPLEAVMPPRVQALGGRSMRALPASAAQASASSAPEASSSSSTRPRTSPVKLAPPTAKAATVSTEIVTATTDTASVDTAPSEPKRIRLNSSRAPRYPPNVLSLQSRSISHSVLPVNTNPPSSFPSPVQASFPTISSAASIEAQSLSGATNLASQPSRPHLATSFSTVSLPGEINDQWQPSRRFAAPARIIQPTDEIGDLQDSGPARGALNPTTPHVLRGAFRPAPGAVPGQNVRKGLGQAQRRAVTAPTPSLPPPPEVDYTPLPQLLMKSAAGGVKQLIEIAETRHREAEAAASIPLPASPTALLRPGAQTVSEGYFDQAHSESGSTPKAKLVHDKAGIEMMDSPLMPMLSRSVRESAEAKGGFGREADLLREESPSDMGDFTLARTTTPDIESTAGPEKPQRDVKSSEGMLIDLREQAGSEPAVLETRPEAEVKPSQKLDMALTALIPAEAATSAESTASLAHQDGDRPVTASAPIMTKTTFRDPIEANKAIEATSPSIPPTKPTGSAAPSRKPALPPIAASRPRQPVGRTVSATMGPPAAPAHSINTAKLPPAAKGVKPRVASAETRKQPFRPTVKSSVPTATTAAAMGRLADSQASGASTTTSHGELPVGKSKAPDADTKAPVKTSTAVARSVPTSTSVGSGVVTKNAGSNVTRPTAVSSTRTAAASVTVPQVRASTSATTQSAKPTVTSSSTTNNSLPPVRAPKAKLKAALPSFKPVRKATGFGAVQPTAAGKGSLANSTTSSLAASRTGGAGLSKDVNGRKDDPPLRARVKVRPEALPLPPSPGETRPNEIPLPPSPIKEEFTGKVKVRMEVLELSESMRRSASSLSGSTMSSGRRAGGGAEMFLPDDAETGGVSRCATAPIDTAVQDLQSIRDSTTAPTADNELGVDEDRINSSQSQLDGGGLPPPISRSQRITTTPYSKTSTATAISDWLASDSESEAEDDTHKASVPTRNTTGPTAFSPIEGEGDEEMEEEQEEVETVEDTGGARRDRRVSFGRHRSAGDDDLLRGFCKPAADPVHGGDEEEKDLIEFSAPSRSAVVYAPTSQHGLENVMPVVTRMAENNQGIEMEKLAVSGLGMVRKTPPSSPRYVLSERNRNGAVEFLG